MGTVANMKLKPCTVTWNTQDLGYTEGDIEVSFSENLTDITSHQTGTDVLGQIRTGKNVEVKLTLKETTVAALKRVFSASGGVVTPSGGTDAVGWGTDKQFTSTVGDAAMLVLHPIEMGIGKTEDTTFWKAYPMVESINYSSENLSTVSVTFKVYRDDSKPAAISFFCFGDGTQSF